jgi:hypothetical protein
MPRTARSGGESAKSTDRSQLQNLLTFCRLNKDRVHFVVVFNLTRFARDKYDYFALSGTAKRSEFRYQRSRQRKWRFANAQPDPDLRYRSKDSARRSSVNCTTTSTSHGRPSTVCGHLPSLCASRRARQSLVTPV